jgi:AraC family transcriptional regulator, activator of mtrCDE
MNDFDQLFAELAPFLRATPEIQKLCSFGESWASPHEPEPRGWAPFHIVLEGACVLDTPDGEPIRLRRGDIAILPHGGAHVVRSSLNGGPRAPMRVAPREHDPVLRVTNTDGEPDTQLICGHMRFEHAHDNMVLAVLPSLFVLAADAPEGEDAAESRVLMQTIKKELDDDRLGAAVIAQELASALMMIVLRVQFQRRQGESGVLALLAKRQSARAVAAMLSDPARDWSLDDLAEVAATSRATLVRLFRKAVDSAPLAYLSELRLSLARRRLAATNECIATVAADVGYQSESAFSRAYHRRYGAPPGADRLASQVAGHA